MHQCPDCGEEIEIPYHVCLDPGVAARYIRNLRYMNSEKSARIDNLEMCLRELITITDRKHDAWDRAKQMLHNR